MNLLIVGTGTSGAWQMRGHQLGAALAARVRTAPSDDDLRWADLVVLVKRAGLQWGAIVRTFKKPVVWDALDGWRQPAENGLDETQATAWLRRQLEMIQPALMIGATQAMARVGGGRYVPHHSWDGLRPTPASERVQTVAYQGNPVYLGKWARLIAKACQRLGWTFAINPADLSKADILVAFRDGPWDGWMCREWKSGVKVVNAIATGRPLISQASAAVRELQPDGVVIEDPAHLESAFDCWTSYAGRQAVVNRAREIAPLYTREAVAARYADLLSSVVREAVTC